MIKTIEVETDDNFESCDNCVNCDDAEEICKKRGCIHAIDTDKFRECYKPNERKKGKWIMDSNFPDEIICSCCNINYDMWFWEQGTMSYCPNCGAEMEDKE